MITTLKKYLRKWLKKPKYDLSRFHIDRLGSDYGKACVISKLLNNQSIVYSVGIGEEISFDEKLMAMTGCQVFGFDPTPRAQEFAEKKKKTLPNFHFVPAGLDIDSGVKTFYFPENSDFVSMSLTQDSSSGSLDVDFLSLQDAMQKTGHDWVDFLKLDIEGAEFGLIEHWMEQQYSPPVGQIWIEFHDAERAGRTHVDPPDLARRFTSLGFMPFFNVLDNGLLLLNMQTERHRLAPFFDGRKLVLAEWA